MNSKKSLNQKKLKRVNRTRAKIFGSPKKPRLAVSRSNRFIYCQVIDDEKGNTLLSASSKNLKPTDLKKTKKEQAYLVGEMLGKKAIELGLSQFVFDKRHYLYHGRVAAIAEGIRKSGIKI